MSNKISLIVALLLLLFTEFSTAKIIPSDELFKEPDTLSVALNPAGTFYIIHETNDDFHKLFLSKTKETTSGTVLRADMRETPCPA